MEILQAWAGHCQNSSSDKVWAACLTTDHQVIAVNGKRGGTLRTTTNQFDDAAKAQAYYESKVAEKSQKNGYKPVPFDDPYTSIPSFGTPSLLTATATPDNPTYQTSHVTPITFAELTQALLRPRFGITEKINGERTLIASDGKTLTAYNRRGTPISSVPDAARSLLQLDRQFVIDGERFATPHATAYAAFDLLELDGQDQRQNSFQDRITNLQNLLETLNPAPARLSAIGWDGAWTDVLQLIVLVPSNNIDLITWLKDNAKEGVILRDLDAPYEIGDTKAVRKFKFRADVDAIITGITPGLNGGSINLALIRPRDGKLIDIGSARSGLTAADMQVIADLLATGQQPVIRVSYLPARTIGTKLAEPTTTLDDLRTDKIPAECTTDQIPANAAAFDKA